MVIFSASPLGVFQQSFLLAAGLFVVGVIGVVVALFRRMRRNRGWLGLAISCIFLIFVGIVMLGVTVRNMSTSTETVTAILDNKTIAQESCSEDGSSCSNAYILSMTLTPRSYDFTVSQAAYGIAKQGECYQVSYYPGVGLFQANTGADLYVASSYITRITQMDKSACPQ
jgi:hypothetical protein